ncbi:MAG: hybrid sensor histidine kinase/response regulator [Verrucomicrobia bacterium]|nr:MAG: hybrid sensor histidine kinase/response regulator [Verrucomicrobiota bacterium]
MMNTVYDYKRFAILYVDDEEKSLKYFRRSFEDTFRIFTAPNAAEGYKILTDHQEEIGVLMSDQRMPGEQGVQLLEKARRLQPRIIRILATAYTDLDAAIQAVNTGAIYKYVTKPWDVPELETTLKRSLEFFMVQLERDMLLREKLSSLHRMLIADRILSLGVLATGLHQRMRGTLDAARRFLDLAPAMLERERVDLNQLRNPAFWQDYHRHVRQQLQAIMGLLENLPAEPPKPGCFDTEIRLHELAEATIDKLGDRLHETGIQIINGIPADLPPLKVDGSQFPRIFDLLIQDELLNLPSGSEVRLEACLKRSEDPAGEAIELRVSDNGPGLPGEAVLSVLDPLSERSSKAADLGLHLMACYFIVYHHGGRVHVERSEENGFSLVMDLPLNPGESGSHIESEDFLIRAMTNERLWERLLAGI